ncbi:MAG TPA: hypothetical protein VKM94_13945 [Blastocatellia bacterium]|nr:hypothetical protein [Blastocatellia bacterium]
MADQYCPACGLRLLRSRSHSFGERIIKLFSSYRTYRCHECGWRGWMRPNATVVNGRGPSAKAILSVIVTLIVTALLALYLVERLADFGLR